MRDVEQTAEHGPCTGLLAAAGEGQRRWVPHPRIIELAASQCDKPVDGA